MLCYGSIMNWPRPFMPLASFAVMGMLGWFWPASPAPAGSLEGSPVPGKSTSPTQLPPVKDTGLAARSAASSSIRLPGSLPSVSPAMEEVFAATGLDRMLLMARFIQTASTAELQAVIDRAAEQDVQEMTFSDQAWLRWVELDLEGALKHQKSGTAWWAFAKMDPEAAMARALQTNRSMLGAVLHSIGQSDPALARKLLAEHPEIDERYVLHGILDGLKKSDPGAATALAMEKGRHYLEEQFKNWIMRDREQALAWMRSLTKPADRRSMEDLALTQLISADPAAGLLEARQLPTGKRQADHTVEAITALSIRDPAAARAAAEAIPAPYARQHALASLAVSLASTDSAAAAQIVASLDWKLLANSYSSQWSYKSTESNDSSGASSAGPTSEGILTRLMSAAPGATADALAIRAVAAGSSNGPFLIPGPLSSAVQKWANVEPEAASTWLKSQPPGPARDQGIEGLTTWLISGTADRDYPAALAWAGAASAEHQFSLYGKTISSWKNKDPEAAAAALEALPMPQADRERLRRYFAPAHNDPFAK